MLNREEREEYIRQQHIYVTTSVVIFSIIQGTLCVILLQRGYDPYEWLWMLPSGYVFNDASAQDTLREKIFHKIWLNNIPLQEVWSFSEPWRDSRRRVICLAYMSVWQFYDIKKRTHYGSVSYHSIKDLPVLAFDHAQIIKRAYALLREQLATTSIAQHFLPKTFTLTEFKTVYDIILWTHSDLSNFRKWVTARHLVIPTGKKEKNVAHRPAMLWKFVG